jgi:hypothetical protein
VIDSGRRKIANCSVSAAPAAACSSSARSTAPVAIEVELGDPRRGQHPQRRGDAAVDDQRIAVVDLDGRAAVGRDRVVLVAAQRLDEAQVGREP